MFSPISVSGQGITNMVLVSSELNCTLLKERLKSNQNYTENQPLGTPEGLISRTPLKQGRWTWNFDILHKPTRSLCAPLLSEIGRPSFPSPPRSLRQKVLIASHILAYGWRAENLNWPIRIQQAEKILVSWRQVEIRQLLSLEMALNNPRKGIYNFKTQTSWPNVKNVNHFVFLSLYFGAKKGSPALCMATRS